MDLILIVSIAICFQLYPIEKTPGPHIYDDNEDEDAIFASILRIEGEGFMYGNIIQSIIFFYAMSKLRLYFNPTLRQEVCRVRILPHGVQIEEYTVQVHHNQQNLAEEASIKQNAVTDAKKIRLKRRFLPREWIIDVIVNEHVTSHRVMSIVLFRLYPQGICSSNKLQFNIKDAALVAAFNPDMVDMTYRECMQMWEGIRDGLELTAYQ